MVLFFFSIRSIMPPRATVRLGERVRVRCWCCASYFFSRASSVKGVLRRSCSMICVMSVWRIACVMVSIPEVWVIFFCMLR